VTRRAALALVLLAMTCLAGCGSSSMSAVQLRTAATRLCTAAGRRLNQIRTPALPAQGAAFLSRGIATLRPELARLAGLRAPGELAGDFNRARAATEQMLHLLQSTLKGLKAGNDPVVAIKTLQQELIPLEQRGTAAWRAAQIPACAVT
jgi:hypothetical protein